MSDRVQDTVDSDGENDRTSNDFSDEFLSAVEGHLLGIEEDDENENGDDDGIESEEGDFWIDDDEDDEDEVGDDGMDLDDDDDDDDDEDDDYVPGGDDDDEPQYTIQVDPSDTAMLTALFNHSNAGPAGQSALIRQLMAAGYIQRTVPAARTPAQLEAQRQRERWWIPKTASDRRGRELLCGGEFGRVGQWALGKGQSVRRPRLKETSRFGAVPSMSKATLPNTNGTVVAVYPSVPYVGQYAKQDYSIFFTATQNFTLHLYNLSQSRITPKRPRVPPSSGSRARVRTSTSPRQAARTMPGGFGGMDDDEDEDDDDYIDEDDEEGLAPMFNMGRRGMLGEDTSLKKIKAVRGEEGMWTITDSDSTRDGERMIYSSITPHVHMLHTAEHESEHTCLDFSGAAPGGRRGGVRSMYGQERFGIWSIRFSADGQEVVAGGGDGRIMVYDIEAQRRSLSIVGHTDDVNAVCFADESSTNILVSGSDDGYVKIWDRRSLSGGTPSGVLVGATEGITYTSPKGDGRYVVVNSKDQAARLYDLRKMKSWSEFEGEPDAVSKYGQRGFDYRSMKYQPPQRLAHPKDCSVMTYRGHSVVRTLIRCHFSPRESTGQGYIYSGSADGLIHIWSLDGQVVQVLDRAKSLPLRDVSGEFTDPSAPERSNEATISQARSRERARDGHCTRDVSWHGFEPSLMSTSWTVAGNDRHGGSIAKHEWKGLGKGGLKRLEDWVEREKGVQGVASGGVQI